MIAVDISVLQYEATGIAKYVLGLYSAVRALKPALTVVGIHKRRLFVDSDEPIVRQSVGALLPRKLWRTAIVPAYCAFARPSFIHFPWNGAVAPYLGQARCITTVHDVLPLEIPGFFQSEEDRRQYLDNLQRDIDRTEVLLTDSEYSRSQILAHFNVTNEPVVIPLATSMKSGLHGGRAVSNYFVYVGGYAKRKGLEKLLSAFVFARKQGIISSQLFLTGKKSTVSKRFDELLLEGITLGIVEEKGYVSDEELQTLLLNAQALVYPSLYEGFGLPPLEAMTVGCPVITTRGTSLPEVCGEAVLYMNPRNQREIIEAMKQLEQSEEIRSDLRVKGIRKSKEFSWDKSAKRFLSCLELSIPPKSNG